jgi:hypothetical protein
VVRKKKGDGRRVGDQDRFKVEVWKLTVGIKVKMQNQGHSSLAAFI